MYVLFLKLPTVFNIFILFICQSFLPPTDQRRTMSVPGLSPQQRWGSDLFYTETMKNRSEVFTAESQRMILENVTACKRLHQDANKRLDQRVKDIQFLKKELEQKLEEIIVEIDALIALKSRVVKALDACKDPLSVTGLCQDERRKCVPAERLQDEVDRELLKETETFERVISLLQHVDEQITEQIRLNRSSKYHLEKDLKGKFEAQTIDTTCTQMAIHSINDPQKYKDSMLVPPSRAVTPDQWEHFSGINITEAAQQRANCLSLRALVESVLEQTANDMQKQVQATNTAFELNIATIKMTKSKLEDQLNKILDECVSQQRNQEDLQVAIAENENFLNVAKAQLALRGQRPAKEQCHDPAQSQLLADVQQLTAQISRMTEAVDQSEEEQRNLVRCQLNLQESTEAETLNLYIDEVICTQLRKPIVIQKF
ncbi:tektin-1 [Thalassophryne amazonica]|uniref:tektin-1 n=1 Tax=Thalassophryne amazonica TaxID=390379 RepID=UPI0014713F5B|nr:tektin-1 [Thalassophryne amazonica]